MLFTQVNFDAIFNASPSATKLHTKKIIVCKQAFIYIKLHTRENKIFEHYLLWGIWGDNHLEI